MITIKKLLAFILISTACTQAHAAMLLPRLARQLTTAALHQAKRTNTTNATRVITRTTVSRNYAQESQKFWTKLETTQHKSSNINLAVYAGIPATYIATLVGYCWL